MLKNGLKAALAMLGTAVVPLAVQADQPMNMSQSKQNMSQGQQPGYTSGDMVKAGQLPGAYNQSASFMCDDGWDVFVTGDYIWWDWAEDVGTHLGLESKGDDTITALTNLNLSPAKIAPGYASGFQVGIGFNMKGMDDWNFYSEYTWYKNSGSGSLDWEANIASPDIDIDIDFSKSISIKYNNVDFLLQRPFYFGKKLTSNFYTGLKALWISKKLEAEASGTSSALGLISSDLTGFNADIKISSWALGPKFGMDSNWLLGYGFRMLSNVSISALYTRYTKSADIERSGSATLFPDTIFSQVIPLTADIDLTESSYGTLRPVLETSLGLGWGSYFCDESFRINLSIGYDFNIYWNYISVGVINGGLYLHGLNVQARFDF